MRSLILIIVFTLFVFAKQKGFSQQRDIVRTLRNNDTCLFLQRVPNVLLYTGTPWQRLYLLDKFRCIKEESLLLKPYDGGKQQSFTWLSFPRLRSASPTVQEVLGGDNIKPNSYIRESQLENLPLESDNNQQEPITNEYNGTEWPATNQDLANINPTFGYKLTLKYNTDPQQSIKLFLHGQVLSPDETIDTLCGKSKENWVGYWLYQTQDIFDALDSSFLSGPNKIYSIKHQEWSCVRDDQTQNPGGGTPGPHNGWICSSLNTFVKYGDMVILKSIDTLFNFHWNIGAVPVQTEEEQALANYTYEEKEDYTPIVVLLDTNDHPQEIGVFENDTCIGANVVEYTDTAVLVRGYMSGNATDSLTFEKYYGTKSTGEKEKVTRYWFRKGGQKVYEKRKIGAAEKSDYFVVSFRKPAREFQRENLFRWNIYPNPATQQVVIEITTEHTTTLRLDVFDTEGRVVARPFVKTVSRGVNRTLWNLTGFNEKKLPAGLYLLKCSRDGGVEVKKLFVR